MARFLNIFAMRTPNSILFQMLTIFLLSHIGADYCKNKRLSNPRGIVNTDDNLSLATWEETAFFVSNYTLKFYSQMPNSSKILELAQGAQDSKRMAYETRQQIINYFIENYPPVKKLKFKSCFKGRFYVVRAKYNGRVLYAKAYNLQVCLTRFANEYKTKVVC